MVRGRGRGRGRGRARAREYTTSIFFAREYTTSFFFFFCGLTKYDEHLRFGIASYGYFVR